MSYLAAARAATAAKKAKQARNIAKAQARNIAFVTLAVVATEATMTPQVKERRVSGRETSTPEVFTYANRRDIIGVNWMHGRQPQEPAAEPEALGNVGHGYWDEVHMGAQLEEWTSRPCGGCGKKVALTLTGSDKGGVGGGTLNFACSMCDFKYPLQR